MTLPRTVVLNGDLGSGKTTISVLLGVRRVSIGNLYRRMAAEHVMTALQFNLHSELDDKVDHFIDQVQHDIAASGERLVVDSRLAWHFFSDAFKVHLIADPLVAARRVLGRPGDPVENDRSVEKALHALAGRSESERQWSLSRVGRRQRTACTNYDLVCNTTRAEPELVVVHILEALGGYNGTPSGTAVPPRSPSRAQDRGDGGRR